MKVALYYPWVYLKSGGERTIAALVANSRHEWTIYTNRYERHATFPELAHARIVELPQVSVRRSVDQVASAAWQIARQKLPLDGETALLVVCEGLGDFITFRNRSVPAVCLCLTPLRAAFDPHYMETYLARTQGTPAKRLAMIALASAFRVVDRVAWRRYRAVVAISREVEARIQRGRLRPGRGEVMLAFPGIDTAALVPTWEYQPYFLLPGRIMWTKNVQLGLEAFRAFRQARPDLGRFRLVIAGFVDEKSRPYLAELQRLAEPIGNVEFRPSPTDGELFDLYRAASAVLCTPFNEDWGIVPLEAMAVGKPVIAVNRGGLRETIRDGVTGYLCEPTPAAFADRMIELAEGPARVLEMGRAAHVHAQSFDMRQFVERVDECLDRVTEEKTA